MAVAPNGSQPIRELARVEARHERRHRQQRSHVGFARRVTKASERQVLKEMKSRGGQLQPMRRSENSRFFINSSLQW
jgi:hypothetical protein